MQEPEKLSWDREPLAQALGPDRDRGRPGLPRSRSGLLRKASQAEGTAFIGEERQQDQVWDGRSDRIGLSTGSELMTFVASTGAPDRNGNVLDLDGWELANYRANPVVLFNHNWDLPPVGRTTRLYTEGLRLLAQVEFAPTPLGQELALLNADGYMRAISVGAHPLEWEVRRHPEHGFPIGIHSHRQELLELSIVAIPANPATVRAGAGGGLAMFSIPTPDLPADAILAYLVNPRLAHFPPATDSRAFRDGGPSDATLQRLLAIHASLKRTTPNNP